MNEEQKYVIAKLFGLQDESYREFHLKLMPTVECEKVIGVRTPDLRKLAKEFSKTDMEEGFLNSLPHDYIESKILDTWTHNKTIQKAAESYRITAEKKAYLKLLKVK